MGPRWESQALLIMLVELALPPSLPPSLPSSCLTY
jgi:hypothetical protein